MKKLLLIAGLVTTLTMGAFAYVITPPPVPLFDANRRLLAENEVQGYCSGVWMFTRISVDRCYEDNPDMSRHRSLYMVIPAFCRGVIDSGWDGSMEKCRGIMEENQYWPLLAGGTSNAWSARYAYPLDRFVENTVPDDSRTGEREGLQRK
jgi:hypothetical protein